MTECLNMKETQTRKGITISGEVLYFKAMIP